MKVFVMLLVAFCSCSTHAVEKIQEAFGYQLGDSFGTVDVVNQTTLKTGEPIYQINALDQMQDFDRYYMLITQKSKKIYALWGEKQFINTRDCQRKREQMLDDAIKKYLKNKERGVFNLEHITVVAQEDKYFSIGCRGFTDLHLEVRYFDGILFEQAQKERMLHDINLQTLPTVDDEK